MLGAGFFRAAVAAGSRIRKDYAVDCPEKQGCQAIQVGKGILLSLQIKKREISGKQNEAFNLILKFT